MATGADCRLDNGSSSLFENTDFFAFNHDGHSRDDQKIVVDVDAFIDSEFGKIYEGEAEKEESQGSQSVFVGQVQLLSEMTTQSSGVDDVFAAGYCDEEAGRQGAGYKQNDQELICSQCRALRKFTYLDGEGNRRAVHGRHKDLQVDPNVQMKGLVVAEEQLSDIRDEVGTCYRQLAPKLGTRHCILRNIDEEYKRNADKAHAILMEWKQRKGPEATVMALAETLEDIGRKDIAGKLFPDSPITNMPSDELSLKIKSQLPDKALLCEDRSGKKYIVREVASTDRNKDEIVQSETSSKQKMLAVDGVKQAFESKRQESFKRIREELDRLQERLKKHRVDVNSDEQSVPNNEELVQVRDLKVNLCSLKDLEELFQSCEFQCQSWQGMYNGLVKLIGEVGSLEENSQAVQQLSDFTKEMQQQEKRFFPKITELEEQHERMNESQVGRLDELKKWRKTQSQQLEGIEKLLASLLERPKSKAMNRRSEPNLSFLPKVSARRRSKTADSGGRKLSTSTSLLDLKEEVKISKPLNPRKMYCFMDTNSTN